MAGPDGSSFPAPTVRNTPHIHKPRHLQGMIYVTEEKKRFFHLMTPEKTLQTQCCLHSSPPMTCMRLAWAGGQSHWHFRTPSDDIAADDFTAKTSTLENSAVEGSGAGPYD